VGPEAAHAGEVVLELRQLHLQVALGGMRVVGKDVEDGRRPVHHGHADRLLEIAFLTRQELVVTRDQVRAGLGHGALQLLELALAEVCVRVGMLAALHHLAGDRNAGGAQELLQLRQLVAPVLLLTGRQHRDAQRPLTGTWVDDSCTVRSRVLRLPCASVPLSP
jgi:hypothetical protein